jgi:uncharacterized protein YraI
MISGRHRVIISALLVSVVLTLALTVSFSSAQTSFGVNWTGTYYNSTNLDAPGTAVATVSYPNGLNFTWAGQPSDGLLNPVPNVGPDNFTAVYTSTQTFTTPGTYTFTITIDDQAKVQISGIEVFRQTLPGSYSFNYPLAAGNIPITVTLVELTQTATIQFSWTLQGAGVGTPGGGIGTPIFTATPSGPSVNVVNVRGLSLRSGPYLGASFIGVLRPNTAYPVSARNVDEGGGFTWYRVQSGDRVGWSSGRYLTVSIDPLTLPLQSTIFEQIDGAGEIGVNVQTRAVMNLRRRPSVRSAVIGQVPWGAVVPLLGRTVQGGQNFWFHVRYNGVTGWVYAPFLRVVQGPIDAVPIR